ncbi:MAG: 2-amino-4-hydroxy-6-hydroxymethyldihydropteridine diphosphokinase [Treponema sp.]|nr:2-amino-4-hydroxy-6-hydroxymethyldihydropteridine diphosphokinase [Treponema sp.]
MNLVVLGLGSNRSHEGQSCIELLLGAVKELEKILDKAVISSVYRTKAMYVTDQDDFYNMVIAGLVEDNLDPHSLLEQIHEIESSFGRDRSKELRFGPRSIDIDIEFFGNLKVNTAVLEIPHPRVKERAFVLEPLLEIYPELADSMIGEQLKDTLNGYVSGCDGVELFMTRKDFSLKKVHEEQNGKHCSTS